jgi:hypothetical protein
MTGGKFAALQRLLSKGGDKSKELLDSLQSSDIGAKLSGLASEAKSAGGMGLSKLDQQLGKIPFMAAKQDPLASTDAFADPRKRNALLAALGLGGAAGIGGISYAMDDED